MTKNALRRPDEVGGNTATGLLKVLALICMFADHIGARCIPAGNALYYDMRVIGRIAFPLYCWCMVVGACYTRSMPRYMLRLALVGLVSQPLYMVALNHAWNVPNIFLTLLVGLCGIWGMREKRWGSQFWAPVLALMAAVVLKCGSASYGWKGVLLMMLLYAARGSRKTIAAVMIPFCLFWGSGMNVPSLFGISLTSLRRGTFSTLITPWLQLQSMAILALPLMIWPDEVRIPIPAFLRAEGDDRSYALFRTRMPDVRMPAWLGYAIYPAHLVLLILLQYAMDITVHWEHLANAWTQFAALF